MAGQWRCGQPQVADYLSKAEVIPVDIHYYGKLRRWFEAVNHVDYADERATIRSVYEAWHSEHPAGAEPPPTHALPDGLQTGSMLECL